MEWTDQAIILSLRRYGESRSIAELLTRDHGRHMGLVRGASKKHGTFLQPGSSVRAVWRARLEEHLGTYVLEPVTSRAAIILGDGDGLLGLSSAAAVLNMTLPEREPHASVYDALELLMDTLGEDEIWPALYVRWELGLLGELGFGLELDTCAVTGVSEGLSHVSPKTGKAVSREEAAPYVDRLLRLPGFLASFLGAGANTGAAPSDISDGLALSGHFLDQRIWSPHGVRPPDARVRLVQRMEKLARG